MPVAPASSHLARHTRLREALREASLDALLVTSLPNVAYLTGLFASAAAVVIAQERVILITDGRYLGIAEELRPHVPGLELVITPATIPFDQALADALSSFTNGRAGFELTSLTVKRFRDLERRLVTAAPGCVLEGTEGIVERLRVVKDDWELGRHLP